MSRNLLGRWGRLIALASPALLYQTTCSTNPDFFFDPDIAFRAFLQILGEVSVFALDNLLISFR